MSVSKMVVAAAMVLGLVSAAQGVILNYEMDVAPDDASLAAPMTKAGDGFGDAVAGDLLPTGVAGLLGDGTARFVDTGSNGNDGFYVVGLGATLTVDMKVKSNSAVGNTAGDRRSMSVHDGVAGRGIRIEPDGLEPCSGSGGTGKGLVDLTSYHMIRLSVSGGTLSIYDLQTTPGNWTLLASTAMGGSGAAGELVTAASGGIALNSLSGGNTRKSDVEWDWVRVDVGTARGATGEIILPEPVSLALFGLGGLAMIRRRR